MNNNEFLDNSLEQNGLLATIMLLNHNIEQQYGINPEFSFGHIVLSDYNLGDSSIDFCLTEEQIIGWVSQKVKDGNNQDWKLYSYDSLMTTTDMVIVFLMWLKTVPEEIRDEVGY